MELPCFFLTSSAQALLTIKLQRTHLPGKVPIKQEQLHVSDMLETESAQHIDKLGSSWRNLKTTSIYLFVERSLTKIWEQKRQCFFPEIKVFISLLEQDSSFCDSLGPWQIHFHSFPDVTWQVGSALRHTGSAEWALLLVRRPPTALPKCNQCLFPYGNSIVITLLPEYHQKHKLKHCSKPSLAYRKVCWLELNWLNLFCVRS